MPEYIGVYRLESPLGKGGMGEVFLAWDERLERPVAVKRVRRDAFTAPHQRDRFRREARMAARLSHAAIVQIHDLVNDNSGDAIVMEYVKGITLKEKVARGLPTADAVRLAGEIARGLAAAHSAGLIHRDLKAENVIVTPEGHAKILDFGLARPVDQDEEQLTQQGAIVGTSYAMSPEQASGEDHLDERSDLFSFGALLYEMLSGRSPFRGKNSLETLKRVVTEHPPPLASVCHDLPPGLTSLVDWLLAKNRDERPGSAAEVASRLERIERELLEGMPEPEETISDLPTAAFPVLPRTSPERVSAAPRLIRPQVLLAAALLVVAAGIFLLALQAMEPKPEPVSPPLRVLVLKPEFKVEDQELALIASGVQDSALAALEILEGIKPIEPTEVKGSPSSSKDAAVNAAATDTLWSKIEREEQKVQVSLRLIKADSAQDVDLGSFHVLPGPKDLYGLTDIVGKRLTRVYSPDFPLRVGARPQRSISEQDYAEFLKIFQDIESGKSVGRPELDRLDRIIDSSPSFLEAYIRAARVAVALYRSTHEASDLERARSYVKGASETAPDDRRTLRESFYVVLLDQQYDEAETILHRIEEKTPGDPDNLFLKFRLLESQGNIDGAYEALSAAVEQSPSWRNIYWLSDLERRRGQIDEARNLLQRLPSENIWVREQLAFLELMYGEATEAEKIYRDLARSNPQSAYFTNLGLALSFQRRYQEAKEAYDRALDLKPGDVVTLLNLADAERSLGNKTAAKGFYGSILKQLKEGEHLNVQAQCFAHLGQQEKARKAVRRALQQQPDDPQFLYEASLVFSALGNREEALEHAKLALDGGIPKRLFSVSPFDDAFRADLQAGARASAPVTRAASPSP